MGIKYFLTFKISKEQKQVVVKFGRRRFFRMAANMLLLVFLYALAKLSRLHEIFTETKIYTVDISSLKEGFNFFERFIVVKKKNGIDVFSAKCTHLGCRINKAEGEELVCPCHGSRYNKNGQPVKGPAPQPLAIPEYEIADNKIFITFTG